MLLTEILTSMLLFVFILNRVSLLGACVPVLHPYRSQSKGLHSCTHTVPIGQMRTWVRHSYAQCNWIISSYEDEVTDAGGKCDSKGKKNHNSGQFAWHLWMDVWLWNEPWKCLEKSKSHDVLPSAGRNLALRLWNAANSLKMWICESSQSDLHMIYNLCCRHVDNSLRESPHFSTTSASHANHARWPKHSNLWETAEQLFRICYKSNDFLFCFAFKIRENTKFLNSNKFAAIVGIKQCMEPHRLRHNKFVVKHAQKTGENNHQTRANYANLMLNS